MTEVWKEIDGYDGLYQVSNLGNVKRIEHIEINKNGIKRVLPSKMLAKRMNEKGYARVTLFKENKGKNRKIHRLVAEAFIPNPMNLPQINHKDENKLNNQVSNLEWCTNQYNCSYGEKRHQKLSESVRLWWERKKQDEAEQ